MQRQAPTSSFECIATIRPSLQDWKDVLATGAVGERCPTTPNGRRSTRRTWDVCSRLPIVPRSVADDDMMKTPSQPGHCEGHQQSQYSPPLLMPLKRRRYNNDDDVGRDTRFFFRDDDDDQRDNEWSLSKRKRSTAEPFSPLPSSSLSRLNLPVLSFDDVDDNEEDDDHGDDDSREPEKKARRCSTGGSTLCGRDPPVTLPLPKISLPRRRGRQKQQQRQNHKVLRLRI